jgi:4,5-DOPA dioxygenase extradiol
LIDVVTRSPSQKEREQQMMAWDKAPSARYCHPREEHLMPLHVCLGMANKSGELIFDDTILGKRAVAFLWG